MQEWVLATCTARRKSHASPLESHADAANPPRRNTSGLSDIDIEAAQVDGAKLIERVIDLVELERFVGCWTIANHFIHSLENPPVNQAQVFPGFLVS